MLGHYLKIWADKWSCTGEVKGGTVPLNHRNFIVTSNYSIEQVFGPEEHDNEKAKKAKAELVAAIKRRFNEQYIESQDKEDMVDEDKEEVKSPAHKRPKLHYMFLTDVKTGQMKLTEKGPTIGAALVQQLKAPHMKRVDTTLPFEELED